VYGFPSLSRSEEQQKQINVLPAQLKKQAAQIQNVSAQLEASKPAPQAVNNPQAAAFHNQPSRFSAWRLFVHYSLKSPVC